MNKPDYEQIERAIKRIESLQSQLLAAQAQEVKLREAIANLLKDDGPYPLDATANILVEAVQVLLNDKSYDGEHHERFAIARNYATLVPNAVNILRQTLSTLAPPVVSREVADRLSEALKGFLGDGQIEQEIKDARAALTAYEQSLKMTLDRFQPPTWREQDEMTICRCCDARKHYTELDDLGHCADCREKTEKISDTGSDS